jgi:4-diphosphocytidyl-2-C-methyl-D-erythritol kinase
MEAFSGPLELPGRWPDADSLAATLLQAGNDLEAPAIGIAPAIAEVLAALRGQALLARMSGSGATCFGLFASAAEAKAASARLARPGWWVWGGGLHGFGLADGAPAT